MAKQDAIADHPYQAEKESAVIKICKNKQFKGQDPVDVASLAVGEPSSIDHHLDSPRPSRRSSSQEQLQPSSPYSRLASGSPPTQALLLMQEHPSLKNTSSNKPTATSPAGGVIADRSLSDPLPSNSTAALAVDLDPASIESLDNTYQPIQTNAGLARWHTWVIQQTGNNGMASHITVDTSSRDYVLEITPSAVIQYLEDVVLPLEQASSSPVPVSTTNTTIEAESEQKTTPIIETYLKPVLQLWQHQYRLQEKQLFEHQRQQQGRQQEQPCCHSDPSSSSSSVTMSSELKSFHEGLDDRAAVANIQHTSRLQDQLQRLIHLEKSHQNIALVISQLQDQVQRLLYESTRHTRHQLQSHQDKDQTLLSAPDNEPGSNGSTSLAVMSGRHTTHNVYSPSTRQHLHRQQQQRRHSNGYYSRMSESHRAEELIEVIAKGLEEYHTRVAYEGTRQSSGTDTSTAAPGHPSWRHIDLSDETALGPSHRPQSPHDSAIDYHDYDQETLDRSLGSHQHLRATYHSKQSPSQIQHNTHRLQHQHHKHRQQRPQTQQIHTEFHQDDLLEVPPLHALKDRPVRSRKRSSSMSGPGDVHKENIKQARSCSPPHPRITSDIARTEHDGSEATPMAAVVPNSHFYSQPPISPVGNSGQEPKQDGHLKSTYNSINMDTSASSTAAASLAMLHYGFADRARQHSMSPHPADYRTRQQSTHPYTTSGHRLQVQSGRVSDRYPSRPPQDHAFNYITTQTSHIAPPPYGEDNYHSYPDEPHQPMRHHSHPSQSYPRLEDIVVESMAEPIGYESHNLETRVSPHYSHASGTITTFSEPNLSAFRGKHTKHQETSGHSGRIEPMQQRCLSHLSPSQQTSALSLIGKPHPYQRDESRIYSGYEQQQHQHQQQQQQQHQLPQLSRRHDMTDKDVKSSHAQLKEYQHRQQHHYHPPAQQQQPQQQQHQLDQHYSYHHDLYHQQSLQPSLTSSPPSSSSNLHQHQHQHQHYQHPPPPIYVMNRQVNTVPELWKEWTVGLGPGNPSIRQLEAQYGPSWRTSSSAANFFSRRLRIIHEIQRMVDYEGLTEDEAVNRLEARREQGVVVPGSEGHSNSGDTAGGGAGMSLHRLSEILRKKLP